MSHSFWPYRHPLEVVEYPKGICEVHPNMDKSAGCWKPWGVFKSILKVYPEIHPVGIVSLRPDPVFFRHPPPRRLQLHWRKTTPVVVDDREEMGVLDSEGFDL